MASDNLKSDNWQIQSLPQKTQQALEILSRNIWLKKSEWYLAGGTALALSVGHRQSQDLDFFTPNKEFSSVQLINKLEPNKWKSDIIREGTVYGKINDTQISFIAYPFFKPQEKYLQFGSVNVLDPKDIAVMKIIAISQRGKKRDFIDLYWYLNNRENLLDILNRLPKQYPTVNHNFHYIIRSLMYFEDAESEPMPKIFFKANWTSVKRYFRKVVPEVTKKLLFSK